MRTIWSIIVVAVYIALLILLGASWARAQQIEITSGAEFGYGVQDTHNRFLIFPVDIGYVFQKENYLGHWYQGHWEVVTELFTGYQWSPNSACADGGAILAQFNFDTKSQWEPFFNFGAGFVLTNVGTPLLGGHTNFDLQAAGGLRYFFTKHDALVFKAGWRHFSSADIHEPNRGLNLIPLELGWTHRF